MSNENNTEISRANGAKARLIFTFPGVRYEYDVVVEGGENDRFIVRATSMDTILKSGRIHIDLENIPSDPDDNQMA